MYGDAEEIFKKKENVIMICNHQSTGKNKTRSSEAGTLMLAEAETVLALP